MFEFAWLPILFALPLPLFVRLLPARESPQLQALTMPNVPNNMAAKQVVKTTPWYVKVCAILAWCCLVAAAARPQWLGEPVSIPNEAREMMLAVDLSGSMKIEDMLVNGRQVNRLTMIKSVLHDFIKRRVGDRLGNTWRRADRIARFRLVDDEQEVRHVDTGTQCGIEDFFILCY